MKFKKVLAMTTVAAMVAAMSACSSTNSSSSTDNSSNAAAQTADSAAQPAAEETTAQAAEAPASAAAAPGEAAGFTEYPISDQNETEVEVMPGVKLNVAGVYFQPVDYYPAGAAPGAADNDIHIEADISGGEGSDKLGYGVGDWIPYLTVDYSVVDESGAEKASGTFMEMNASDGPHYGANIKLPDAGTYTCKFTIHSPEENGFLIHMGEETGPEVQEFWKEPVTVEFANWNYEGPVQQ